MNSIRVRVIFLIASILALLVTSLAFLRPQAAVAPPTRPVTPRGQYESWTSGCDRDCRAIEDAKEQLERHQAEEAAAMEMLRPD